MNKLQQLLDQIDNAIDGKNIVLNIESGCDIRIKSNSLNLEFDVKNSEAYKTIDAIEFLKRRLV